MPGAVEVRSGLDAGYAWSEEMLQVADRAEALMGRSELPTLQELLDVSQDWWRFGFLALTPAVVARSARLSARLGVPVLAGVAPLDQQADEAFATRWRVHDQAGGVIVQPVEDAPLPEALEPEPPREAPAVPEGWISTEVLLELVGISRSTLTNRLKTGAVPPELWLKIPPRIWWSPEVLELPSLVGRRYRRRQENGSTGADHSGSLNSL